MELTAQVLRDMARIEHPALLVGPDHFEDAGVYKLSESTAIVQTVDFFPPLVDDPFAFGQIAAANALSDLYAMGAAPITALNLVAFPDKDLPGEILTEILRGGADRVRAAGAVILGGHSVRDSEVKYGLACTGVIHPDRIIANNTAKPGDILVLTKPIGSGVLTSAAKKDMITEAELSEAIEVMTALNDAACTAMLEAGASSATDVTGFGLLGHAFEMAEGASVSLEIEAGAVPLLSRTYDLASQGVLTRAHRATLEHLGDRLEIEGPDEVLVNILADAQTSGGLLISLPEPAAKKLLATRCSPGGRNPTRIGRVTARTNHAIILRA